MNKGRASLYSNVLYLMRILFLSLATIVFVMKVDYMKTANFGHLVLL